VSEVPGRIPIEFRLAIGASLTPTTFDGSRILSLCYRDPWVGRGGVTKGGNLVTLRVRDTIDADFAPRGAASPKTPRTRYSTGYGVRLAWDVTMEVETSRIGHLPFDAIRRPEINDGSLFHLLSIIATSRSLVEFESGEVTPYLWLTTNYQHWDERWFPVEVDPDNATIDPVEFTDGRGISATRTMRVRFVSRDNYRLVLPEYVPSFDVEELDDLIVTQLDMLTEVPDPAPGYFTTRLILNTALPARYGVTDSLLVNLNNTTYGWKLFTIQNINNDERTDLSVSCLTTMGGSFAIPPAPACDAVRGVRQSSWYLPTYCVTAFDGVAIAKGQQSLTGARLLGESGCPPGAAVGSST
jgi:hypothetical protein